MNINIDLHFTNSNLKLVTLFFASLFILSACGAPEDTGTGGSGGGSGGGGSPLTSSVTLTWESPTTNTDNTCLNDLSGYKVYYGTSSGSYSLSEIVDVNTLSCSDTGASTACGNVQSCTYTVDGLPSGQWFFSVSGYNSIGDSSPFSNEAVTVIN